MEIIMISRRHLREGLRNIKFRRADRLQKFRAEVIKPLIGNLRVQMNAPVHDPGRIDEHVPALRLNVDAFHNDAVMTLNE